jgi:DNA (cytosine-5)-methyltransferase 1
MSTAREQEASCVTSRSLDVTAIFGGIGGLEVGLHRSGHRTTLFCECDPDATAVLAARLPDVPITPDVRRTEEVVGLISPRSNLLSAGFPCTDLSQAGKTMGFAGGRSSLIRETIELLRRRTFPNVLIENVPNWRMLHGGQYLSEVLGALEGLGYRWAYRTIDARAFGVPQRRHRIFVFASLEDDPRNVLFIGDATPKDAEFALDERAHGFYWTEGNRGLGWGEDCVPTLKGGSAIGIPAPPAILRPEGAIVTPDITDAERMQGLKPGWTDLRERLQGFGGGRFNQRRRWVLVGNAVNVEVAAWIGEQLARPQSYDGADGEPIENGRAWPAAAWFDGTRRRKVALGTWPVSREGDGLTRFLKEPGVMLSLRATGGFYARIRKSSLRFKPGFVEAVERHLRRMERLEERFGRSAPKVDRELAATT